MNRLLLILACIAALLIPTTALCWMNVVTVGGGTPDEGGESYTIDDDFSSDTSADFTVLSGGALSVSGAALVNADWSKTYAYHETATGSNDHWVCGDIYHTSDGDNTGLIVGSNGTDYYFMSSNGGTLELTEPSWNYSTSNATDTLTIDTVYTLCIEIATNGSSHAEFTVTLDESDISSNFSDLIDDGDNVTRGQYIGVYLDNDNGNDPSVDNLQADSGTL